VHKNNRIPDNKSPALPGGIFYGYPACHKEKFAGIIVESFYAIFLLDQ
jgi:hypothetical protein